MDEKEAIGYAEVYDVPESIAKQLYDWALRWYPHHYKIIFFAAVKGYTEGTDYWHTDPATVDVKPE